MTLPLAIQLFGPTASGKTSLAVKLAQALNGEIINADSQQVYAGLPIITAQPEEDEKQGVPHHLFGCLQPNEPLDAGKYLALATQKCEEVLARGKVPLFVGGTGMYLDVLARGISPLPTLPDEVKQQVAQQLEAQGQQALYDELKQVDATWAAAIDPADSQRTQHGLVVWQATGKKLSEWQQQPRQGALPVKWLRVALCPPRPVLRARISQRWGIMQQQGVVEEVRTVWEQFKDAPTQGVLKSIGVPELAKYFTGEWALQQAADRIETMHQQYAKRQRTWLRNNFVADVALLTGDAELALAQLQQGA